MHNNSIIFDRLGDKVLTGKLASVYQNGSLLLRNVGKSDAGKYTPSVYDDGELTATLKTTELCVTGRLHTVFDSSNVV